MVVRVIQSEWIFLQLITENTGDAFAGKRFASPFLQKFKNYLTHFRNSEYDAVQESPTGPHKSCDDQ